jgi:hypothetical protein
MAAHKANEVGIPQLIEAVGNPVPTAPVGAMVRTELGMAKAAGAGAKGAGQLGAKISVAENATARAAAQPEVTTSVRGKLPCPDAAKTTGRELAISPWPANRGFIEGTVERKFLMPGETIDRYGFGGGKFVSPTGTPFEIRALRPGTESLPYNNYRVAKPFEVNSGAVAPAFNQPGLGTQYELPISIDILLKRGVIEKVP